MFVCGECGQRHDRPGYCPADGRPLVATDDPLLGTEVGRYRLASLLGEGGMGRVYLGVQPAIGSRVAVKILSDQCARDPALLERFFAEAKSVNLIRHESIVSVLDLARLDDGRPYIVMEFVEGHVLGSLIVGAPAPLGGLVQIFVEVLSALEAAHQIGIVHRDLKPDNILITGEGHAKVLDFGIAKLAPGLSHLSPRTATGALLGTPAYMAPEQISGNAIDPRTDIYAAGIVFYEAVTGRVPFQGETLFDLMKQHLEVPPTPPSRIRPDLPPELEYVILTALQKQPAHRFQTALAMAEATSQAASALSPDQWRALVRGGVITGGPASISLRPGSGRRPAPGGTRPPLVADNRPASSIAHDRTDVAPVRGSAPQLGDRTAAASPRGRESAAPPFAGVPFGEPQFVATEAASPRGRASAPPPLGSAAPFSYDAALRAPPPTTPSDGASAPPPIATVPFDDGAARTRGPSAPPPNHPYVAQLGGPRAHPQSAAPPMGSPFERPSAPVYDRPSEPISPYLVPRTRDPASASQTRLAPENRKKRWPFVFAIFASAAIATTITLLVARGGSPDTPPVDPAPTKSSSDPGPISKAADPRPDDPKPGAPNAPPPQSTPPGAPAGSGETRGVPPIIAGSGSAADHGVHIGSNVAIGPGVIIGSNPPAQQKTGVVDYNPTKFDPLAYLPKARALARQIYPDAELTQFEFYENVLPDGWVDLTLKSSSTSYYEFRSPSRSVFPPTRNATNDDIPCYVTVDITATGVKARVREDDECDHALRAPPKCTFAEVWKLSRTKDTKPATIGFLTDGQWFFDHDHAAKHPMDAVTTSVKDCR